MSINWDEIQKALSPVKDYEDLCGRLGASFAYPLVPGAYDFSMPDLAAYTQRLLGGDARGRYQAYSAQLTGLMLGLQRAGVMNVGDLLAATATRAQLERLSSESGTPALDIVSVLKYLLYWVIPMQKYLGGLVRDDPASAAAIQPLREMGIRYNLDLLQQGLSASGRKALVKSSGLPEPLLLELLNRADFSRLPWASKATISNIIGAGYPSLARLANADPQQLYADFFTYGKSIGKNLKLGNEIENSYRIARILPPVLQDL